MPAITLPIFFPKEALKALFQVRSWQCQLHQSLSENYSFLLLFILSLSLLLPNDTSLSFGTAAQLSYFCNSSPPAWLLLLASNQKKKKNHPQPVRWGHPVHTAFSHTERWTSDQLHQRLQARTSHAACSSFLVFSLFCWWNGRFSRCSSSSALFQDPLDLP